MSKILDTNELLELAEDIELPGLGTHLRRLESAAEMLTEDIAKALGIAHTGAKFERAFGGLCGVFKPAHDGQPMPEAMEPYDTGGDWEL